MNRPKSPQQIYEYIQKRVETYHEIQSGLNGSKFSWGEAEAQYKRQYAGAIGITLVTKTQIKKMGKELKRNAAPVGRQYFGRPISKYHDLYILECHVS